MEHILYFTKKMHAFSGKILYINLLGMVFISLLEGMGILLLIPLLSISGIQDINIGMMSSYLTVFESLKDMPKSLGLLLILGAYLILLTGQTLIQRNLSLRDIKINIGFINHIRMETYRDILQANWEFFIKKRKSDLINSLTEELGRVANGTYVFLQFLASLVFTFIQIGIAFWLSAEMTIFVLCCGAIMAIFSRRFIKRSRNIGNQTSDLSRSYIGGITDHMNGIKDIKSNMLEDSRNSWLQEWCQRVGIERVEHARLRSNSQMYYKITAALIIAFFVYVSAVWFHVQGGQLLLIILIFSRLWPRFTGIQSNLEQLAAEIPALKALRQLQTECVEAREVRSAESYMNIQSLPIEEGIEVRNVHYRYNPQQQVYALQDISLHIRAKQMTAIIGRSGAGKSTLIDILMGLLQPENGQVLIDGVPLNRDNLLHLRKGISYVPQDPVLFHASIRENLLLVDPNATEAQMWTALHFSAAAEFVRKLPLKLDTFIGDRGIRLSGGERQRIVLARAILRKPSILILDEATSALDTENEAKIQDALDQLKGTMTIIVIAHRLTTLRNADQVIVLDKGKIVQQGLFNQLAAEREGLFSSLLGKQMHDSKMRAIR